MINRLKILIILAVGSLMFMIGLAPRISTAINCTTPGSAQEAIQCGACNGSGASGQDCANASSVATNSVNSTITNVINILTVVVGVIAVVMIIIGGFRYITSSGNEQAVAGAKRTILYAVIGLVIVALAQIIVKFVLQKATK